MRAAIPGPAGLPLLGSFLQVAGDRLAFLASLRRRYGHTVAFRVGATQFVFVNRPDDVRHVLDEGNRRYGKGVGLEQARTILGDGMLTSDADTAAERRRLFAPLFHRASVEALTPEIHRVAAAHLDRWNTAQPIELMTSMAELTMQIALRVLFGMDGGVDAERLAALFARMERRALRRMLVDLVRPNRKRARDRNEIEQAIAPLLAHDGPLQRAVGTLPPEEAIDELVTLLFAGHETTATALTWTLVLLAQHRDERDAIVADLRGSQTRRLTHAIQEALRLYPPVWLLPRVALESDDLGEYAIDAGTQVIVSPYVLHRDADWWTDPDAFIPSRFDHPLRAGVYIPFGTGPRSCIGAGLAMLETQIVLTAILERFLLQPARHSHIKPLPMLSLRAQPRVWMRLTPASAA